MASVTFLGNRAYRDLLPRDIDFQPFDHPGWLWLFGRSGEEAPYSSRAFDRVYLILEQPDAIAGSLLRAGARSVLHASSRPPEGRHVVEHIHHGFGMAAPPRSFVLDRLSSKTRKDLIWVHPGSGGTKKCLPLDKMASVVEAVVHRTGWDVAVTVGEDDHFLKETPHWERMVRPLNRVLLENRPILELCRDLGSASLFIGNDSGISHLAAGLGVPSAVFFVATDPVQWAPWVPARNLKVMDLRREIPGSDEIAGEVAALVTAQVYR